MKLIILLFILQIFNTYHDNIVIMNCLCHNNHVEKSDIVTALK